MFSFWCAGFFYLCNDRDTLEQFYLHSQTSTLEMTWKTVVKSYNSAMQAYFETYIQQPQVLEIIEEAQNGDEKEQAVQRERLFRYLTPAYQKLQQRDVRQLHFHTPDNRSFLRFHSPNFFGDSLAESRPSVVIANRDHVRVHGFETGRVMAGFRNVFPLSLNGKHLGTVELSQPFEALRKEMKSLDHGNEFLLVFQADLLLPKLIEEQRKLYAPSPFSSEWLVEDPLRKLPDSPPVLDPAVLKIFSHLADTPGFKQKIYGNQLISLAVLADKGFYKVSLIPLVDVEGVASAVLLSLSLAPDLDRLHHNFRQNLLVFSLMIFLALIVIFLYLYYRQIVYEKQQNFNLIANTMPDGLYVVNADEIITFVNEGASRILGYSSEEMVGSSPRALFFPPDAFQKKRNCSVHNVFLTKTGCRGEASFLRRDQSTFIAEIASQPMFRGEKVERVVTIFRDITERKQMEEKLLQMCNTDPLTMIFNRRYFQQTLETEIHRSRRYKSQFVLALCDIDYFKRINDTFGHAMGDKVLVEMSATIQRRIRSADVFARWGGEEFVLLLTSTALSEGVSVAEGILETVRTMQVDSVGDVTVSIGVTMYREEDTADTLLNRADMLLYEAKSAGRNCVRAA